MLSLALGHPTGFLELIQIGAVQLVLFPFRAPGIVCGGMLGHHQLRRMWRSGLAAGEGRDSASK